MKKPDKNRTRDLFFKIQEVYSKSPLTCKELTTALRIENIINSNAIENNIIDSIFLQSGIYRGNIRVKEFSNPVYRKAFLEVKSHDRMLQYLEKKALRKAELTISFLLKIHQLLFERSWPDIAGRFRDIDVRIRGIKLRPPHYLQIHEIIYQHLTWIDGLLKLMGPVSPGNFFEIFHVAADIQRRIIHTYPFRDGNWRIARALTNYVLLYCGMTYCVVDYRSRDEYLTTIENSTITDFSALEDFLLDSYGTTLNRLSGFINLAMQTDDLMQ